MNWHTFTTDHGLTSSRAWALWGTRTGEVWVTTLDKQISYFTSIAGPSPTGIWLEPKTLANSHSLSLLIPRRFKAQFTGLSLAPADEPNLIHYTVSLSHTTSDQIFTKTFYTNTVGSRDVMTVSFGNIGSPLPLGRYELLLTTTDPFQRTTTVSRIVTVRTDWLLGIIVLVTLTVSGIGYGLLRFYSRYAQAWSTATNYPLQQLIALITPTNDVVDKESLGQQIQMKQAFSTGKQIQDALDGLVQLGLMQSEGGEYSLVSPIAAQIHQQLHTKEILILAQEVRRQHPLHIRVREFFNQANFQVEELDIEEFFLKPQDQNHRLHKYGPIYMRLITERAPMGGDFTDVSRAARWYHGETDDMSHRVALVVSDQRPEPGARYRLYEIRQRTGLAIVPLDISLFDQRKPSHTAIDILTSEIDQATGQQNLYAISGPVSGDLSFFGRERVLQEIADLLNVGQPVGLFGLRKVGKTSFIQRLQGRLAQRRPIAVVDAQNTSRQQGIWPLYSHIITAFASHLQQYQPSVSLPNLHLWLPPKDPSPAMADVFVQDLQALHRTLGKPTEDKRLLLIIDEIDRLLPAGETPGYEGFATLFGQLRAANQQAQILDFLVVGVSAIINRIERWQDHDNEMYRALHEIWMPPMASADVQEMIEGLGYQMGIRYQNSALQLLVEAGGGQPFVTRQICSRTIKDQLDLENAVTITLSQARIAIEDFIFDDPYLGEMWRTRLDKTQRKMLRRLARATRPLPRLQLLPRAKRQDALRALSTLENYTLVCQEDGYYTIAWDVFRKWIRWIELGLED